MHSVREWDATPQRFRGHLAAALGVALAGCQLKLDLDRYGFEPETPDAAPSTNPLQPDLADAAGTSPLAPAPDASGPGGPPSLCPACALPHAQSRCSDAGCAIATCVGAWRDENGSPADGCETGDVPAAGLALWFMADRGVVIQDAYVSTWLNQSSDGYAATQAVAAQRPELQTRPDGMPMLSFDGTNDYLDLPRGFARFDGASFFAVVEALANPLCAGLLHFSNGPDGDDVEFGRHEINLLYYEVGGDPMEGTREGFVTERRLLVSIIQAGASTGGGIAPGTVDLRIDGSPDRSGVIGLPVNVERTQNYVGRNAYSEQPLQCSMYFRGRIGEIVFYPRGLTAPERDRVESYLLDKWQGAD
jgi:hypothetical protein